MSKFTIMVCDHIHQSGLDLLAKATDVEMLNLANLPKDELKKELYKADIAITRSSTDVDESFLEAAKKLRAVVRAGVGVDNVDIEASSKKGVVVMNVPTANTIAAVELTCAHILSAIRTFPSANAQLKNERKWKREDWYGTELKGKKLGIIGFGNIGSRVGKLLRWKLLLMILILIQLRQQIWGFLIQKILMRFWRVILLLFIPPKIKKPLISLIKNRLQK